MFKLHKIQLSGALVLPIIEGGKGIGVTNGFTAGSFAKSGAVGTFSAVNADFYDEKGNYVPQTYNPLHTRRQKFEQLIEYAIKGAVAQARIAHDIACGNGRIHMNILWEAGGSKRVIEGVLHKAKGLIHGITCGAGLPYDLAEIATKYKVYYYPIISSARAFRVLWKRAYHKLHEFLGAVVYEDPWVAGGHSGLSNKENPNVPEAPYLRVVELRKTMNEYGLTNTPIVMAGGVWALKEWTEFLDNPEVGNIAFQFGTRPLLTKESPISNKWKKLLPTLTKDDLLLNKFSPTGFYSIAVRNNFLEELIARNNRQICFSSIATPEFSVPLTNNRGVVTAFIRPTDTKTISNWQAQGFDRFLKTPESTLIFVNKNKAQEIKEDQANCMGCLSQCRFSNWSDKEPNYSTFNVPDPRSFCIQKTLQNVIHSDNIEKNLLFSGANGYRFGIDPFYQNGFIPSIAELVERICLGE